MLLQAIETKLAAVPCQVSIFGDSVTDIRFRFAANQFDLTRVSFVWQKTVYGGRRIWERIANDLSLYGSSLNSILLITDNVIAF